MKSDSGLVAYCPGNEDFPNVSAGQPAQSLYTNATTKDSHMILHLIVGLIDYIKACTSKYVQRGVFDTLWKAQKCAYVPDSSCSLLVASYLKHNATRFSLKKPE